MVLTLTLLSGTSRGRCSAQRDCRPCSIRLMPSCRVPPTNRLRETRDGCRRSIPARGLLLMTARI